MANVTFMPFDHEPTATDQDSSGTYSPASGKYARVVVTLSASARAYFTTYSGVSVQSLYGSTDSTSIEIWLTSSDTISKSEIAASATSSLGTSDAISSDSTASVSVDNGTDGATVIATVKASASGAFVTGGSSSQVAIDGSADVDWHIEEYDVTT